MKVLAIDQGTTGTKGFTLRDEGTFTAVTAREHRQIYPQAGWVEHDPEELLSHVTDCIGQAPDVDGIGLDNQGETIVAWDARTGRPCCNAIVWQDNRTADACARLKSEGGEALSEARAGLPLDPYFSASKMRWIIDHVEDAKQLLKQGRLRLGTSDAFFLDRLTGQFATDVTTASRTSLMALDTQDWDDELLALFGVPRECLPEIKCTTDMFGQVGKVPVVASIVDQQAALFGHGCSAPGDAKITFGTGAFALAVAGPTRPDAKAARLAATIAWKRKDEAATFALDGAVYNAASAVNWARGLGLFNSFEEINRFEAPSALSRGLCFVPALSGLACPHWDRTAAGMWIGMNLATTKSDLVQAVLEGIALRMAEVIDAIHSVSPLGSTVSIDGGLAKNAYFGQFLADVIGREVTVVGSTELTALGTARMAMVGLGAKNLPPMPAIARQYEVDMPLGSATRDRFGAAVNRTKGWL